MRELSSLSDKMASYRQFQRPSENPFNALSALKVRRTLSMLDTQYETMNTASSVVDVTETTIKSIKQRLDDAMELVLQGKNDVLSDEDRKIIAESLRGLQKEVLNLGNTQLGGRYILGGANTGEPPFMYDEVTGALTYNGLDVNSTNDMSSVKVDVFVDIGLGVNYLGGVVGGAYDGDINKNSVFSLYEHGCDILGFGDISGSGGPSSNIHTLLGQLADIFDSGDLSGIDQYHAQLDKKQKDILVQWTATGERSKQVLFMQERNDELAFQATKRQTDLEVIIPEQVITQLKSQEMIYRAALQAGSYIFPATVFDYLR